MTRFLDLMWMIFIRKNVDRRGYFEKEIMLCVCMSQVNGTGQYSSYQHCLFSVSVS